MGVYKYITKNWRKPTKELKAIKKQRMIEWRKQPSIIRIEKPTRIDKARRVGYKAKQGFVIVRVKVSKGGSEKPRPNKGRRPKRMGVKKLTPTRSHATIAEQRASRKFKNLEVLNSYYAGDDSLSAWYEIIMVDPSQTKIMKDKDVKWIVENKQTRRVFRGLTSSSKRSRGLRR